MEALLGWRKITASLITVFAILLLTYYHEDLPASSWDNAVEWSAIVAISLMGGNAITHVAQAIGANRAGKKDG